VTKIVMITGATSGFGAATARRFAKAGWRVIATGRRADRLKTLVAELPPAMALALTFDIRDTAAMEKAVAGLPASAIQRDSTYRGELPS